MSDQAVIGTRGEEEATRFLLATGFEVLHRNWRSGRYELDIVACKEGVLHIVEVKCRKSGGLTRPEEAMTRHKFASLCCAGRAYVESYGLDVDIQFDLVAVDYDVFGGYEVRYIPDVMVPHW